MSKPTINKIQPFDAAREAFIAFCWSGFQIYSNRIIIRDSASMNVVYDQTVPSMSLRHDISANILENGKTYVVECQVFDADQNASELSNKSYFKTYTAPQFLFTNIDNGNTVAAPSLSVDVLYHQPEAEALYCYRFSLYDSNRSLIFETEDLYDTKNISYVFKGLDTQMTYYIRCHGMTQHEIGVDTGYVEINVNYGDKAAYARIYAENDPSCGGIHYRTNLNVILPESGDFSYEDGKINLIGKTIIYKDGFTISGDFTFKISGNCLYRNGDVLILENGTAPVRISAYIYDDGAIRYKLTAAGQASDYVLYSKPIYCDNTSQITIAVRRIKNLYELEASALSPSESAALTPIKKGGF